MAVGLEVGGGDLAVAVGAGQVPGSGLAAKGGHEAFLVAQEFGSQAPGVLEGQAFGKVGQPLGADQLVGCGLMRAEIDGNVGGRSAAAARPDLAPAVDDAQFDEKDLARADVGNPESTGLLFDFPIVVAEWCLFHCNPPSGCRLGSVGLTGRRDRVPGARLRVLRCFRMRWNE